MHGNPEISQTNDSLNNWLFGLSKYIYRNRLALLVGDVMHESQTKMKWKVFYDVHSDFIKMNESIHIIIWRITLFD